MSTTTSDSDNYTTYRGRGLTTNEYAVMDALVSAETSGRGYMTRVADLSEATGLSESSVRKALEALRSLRLVDQSPNRGSRGHYYTPVTDETLRARAERRQMVEALTEALQSLTGSARGIDVVGKVHGGVGIDLDLASAEALLTAVRAHLED